MAIRENLKKEFVTSEDVTPVSLLCQESNFESGTPPLPIFSFVTSFRTM